MSPISGWFIAGTDTGVGKTLFATALVRAVAARGVRVEVMKPVAAGAVMTPQGLRNDDALALIAAARSEQPYERVNPCCFELAASPHIAAQEAGSTIDRARIRDSFAQLRAASELVVVEGAGGWLAPIGDRETMADVAADLQLPVLLVVGMRLGCLNHALLTREAIERRTLPFAGWVANRIDPSMVRLEANLATLERRLGAAPLAILPPHVHPLEAQREAAVAAARLLT
jgi:dethiobiotin synthetase